MSIEMIRMSKQKITRLFVAAVVAVGAGLVLGFAALGTALATDAVDFGGSYLERTAMEPRHLEPTRGVEGTAAEDLSSERS